MAGRIDKRLKELGLDLPDPSPAFASYLPWKASGNTVYISGQGPLWNGEVLAKCCGKIGADFTIVQGREAARITALNVLAQLKQACGGDLDRVRQCVQVSGFVNCVDGFTETPSVVDGGSDLIVEVFGEAGRHARFAVGSHALPVNIAVELAAVFEID